MFLILIAATIASIWNVFVLTKIKRGTREILSLVGSVSVCAIVAQVALNWLDVKELEDGFFIHLFWSLLVGLVLTSAISWFIRRRKLLPPRTEILALVLRPELLLFVSSIVIGIVVMPWNSNEEYVSAKIALAISGGLYFIGWWSLVRLLGDALYSQSNERDAIDEQAGTIHI